MKAAVVPRYGPPETVRLIEAPDPIAGQGEVVVRIRATTVSSGDARVRGFNVPALFWIPGRLALGILKPRRRILGTEFAGTIESVGEHVTRFHKGDPVFGVSSFAKPDGTHAEFVKIASDGLIEPLPQESEFEQAGCMCFGLCTARHFLQKKARLQAGERLLVVGASGAVGCAAVQLAKHAGAHVTAVCSSRNVELVRSLGADHVIDYTQTEFTSLESGHPRYDVIMDTVGATTPFSCKKVMAKRGRFIANVMYTKTVLQAIACMMGKSMKVIMGVDSQEPEDLKYFREMVEAGAYRSVIDQVFDFERISQAHRRVDSGRKQGNVVIRMSD